MQGSHNDYSVGDGLFSISGCIFSCVAHELHDPWLYFLIFGNDHLFILLDSLELWLVWVLLCDLGHEALRSYFLRGSVWYLSDLGVHDSATLENTSGLMDPHAGGAHSLGAWDDWWRVILAGIVNDVSFLINFEKSTWAESR